jgi:hypothetical protein
MALCMPIELVAFDIGGVLAIKNRHGLNPNINNMLFDQDFFDLQRGKIKLENYLAKINRELEISQFRFENLISAHENIRLLKNLSCPYVFASNINILHYEKFIREARPSLYALKNSGLSFELGYLKPDPLFFELLVNKNNICAPNILFIDDKLENIKSAQTKGLQTLWCKNPSHLPGLIRTLLKL